MFSGKSEEMIRRLRRAEIAGQSVVIFKPRVDDRYDATDVVSHAGVRMRGVPVASVPELVARARGVEVVGIDEVQFFEPAIVDAALALADGGARVVAAGLDQDFRREPFGPMPILLAYAEFVDKLQAVCHRCGGPATTTQRLVDGAPAPYSGDTVVIGAASSTRLAAATATRPESTSQQPRRSARPAYFRPLAFRKAAATFTGDFLSTLTALFIAIIALTRQKALTLFSVDVKSAPFSARDFFDDRRDVLEPEHVLRVLQLHVLRRDQLRVRREHVGGEHLLLIEQRVGADPRERHELEVRDAVGLATAAGSSARLELGEAGERRSGTFFRSPSVFRPYFVAVDAQHGDPSLVLERRLLRAACRPRFSYEPLRQVVRAERGPRGVLRLKVTESEVPVYSGYIVILPLVSALSISSVEPMFSL